ncbi:uncharacterized protein LOC131182808 [Hevea brasiliensis]|uniref:uncharacterized protein LOC131182808 n=1 Tax=Hevea brasiliensis TaxID=3981 RepID=UPI0025D20A7C|nr:uncharacterized protein LOC131182808 [Hevea brasiliensis]
MGDSTQEQLNKMFELLLSEQKANQNRSEQMDQFQAQLDAISRDLQSTKLSLSSSSTESQHRPRKEKDPLGWLSRCQLFFKHQSTLEEEKVGLASIHLEGIAQLWYLQLIQDNPEPTWTDFESQCNKRFGPPIRSNKLGELAKLKQTGSVEDYQNKFETLVSRAGTLTQLQKIQLYISGLQEYIAVEVELHQPQDLVSAMSMSRLYERKLNSRLPSNRDFRRPSNPPEPRTARPIKRLTPDEMDDRRKKGLCFNCDEPFVRGHQCKRLFLIDLAEELQSDEDMDLDPSPEISLHAITGTQTSQSMRLRGVWNGLQVLILVDSGSTHSFISLAKLSENGVNVDATAGVRVKVANGEQLHSPGICKKATINLYPIFFRVDLFALQLTGFDIVLGVNWLRTLGPILWDFEIMQMSFYFRNQLVELRGINSKSEASPELHSLLAASNPDLQLQNLLTEFAAIFEPPKGLPPARNCDHRIPLEPGSKPVVVHPYRYPHGQKDEIERQCSDMLNQGIIRPSRSPFSSSVILVPKADKTWRLCVDYRELNARTIKDKFPIPIIEELLDELGGAQFFTKLDLLAGYYQVAMYPPDIEKTAFRTHHGHFEFLVMPFGLSNAPSTFQSLMNEVFRDYLRKFVLVFFDDILVFSSSWAEHLQHLRQVFQQLAAHKLVLKKPKCSFAQLQVSYLGHIISQVGVQVDNSKISAITDWPQPTTPRGLRGFLGLTGYYRKFVYNYGSIAAPLTALLKKNSFQWTAAATQAFESLKKALTSTPILVLPNFDLLFVIECDASDTGIGAVLLQNNKPVAFFSRAMAVRHISLPAYEKELIGLVKAIRHWQSYLWGKQFVVRTDHYTLKFLLEQLSLSSPQQHWVSKLLPFDFKVEYKPGKANTVADALSRRDVDQHSLYAISLPQLDLFDDIRREQIFRIFRIDITTISGTAIDVWSFKQGYLFFKNRVYIPPESPSVTLVMTALHNQGHEGYQKTLHRITRDFYWRGMKHMIQDFVRACEVCQRSCAIEAVDVVLQQRDEMLQHLRSHLLDAQNRMKIQYDRHHRPLEFQVLERVGTLAYKLQLPPESKIHPAFHVSHSNHSIRTCIAATILPPLDDPAPQAPLTVLGQRIRAGIHEVLIHWKNTNPADSSWERVSDINNRYREFKLEDKLSVVGSIVKTILSYTRRKPRVNIQEIED